MRTESRILQYAFSCVSFLSISTATSAQISYTDPDPDIHFGGFPGFSFTFLDVSGDGVSDFRFEAGKAGYLEGIYVAKLNSNMVGGSFVFAPMPYMLSASASIGSGMNWNNDAIGSTMYAKSSSTYYSLYAKWGNWQTTDDGYLPILVMEADGPHYGWIRMSINSPFATIKDFALNETPYEPILAGQLPCAPPTASASILPSLTEVNYDWDFQIGAVGYQVRSNQIGTSFVDYDTTTSNSIAQSVVPGASYRWQIRSWCGDEFSDYSDVQFFTVSPLLKADDQLNAAQPEIFTNDGYVRLTVPLSDDDSPWHFSLINSVGQEIYRGEFTGGTHSIPLKQVSDGMYFAILEKTGFARQSRTVYLD